MFKMFGKLQIETAKVSFQKFPDGSRFAGEQIKASHAQLAFAQRLKSQLLAEMATGDKGRNQLGNRSRQIERRNPEDQRFENLSETFLVFDQ